MPEGDSMQTTPRSEYEDLLLREIKDLSESEIKKVLKIVHFLKKEILDIKKQENEDIQQFWNSFGSWQDERSAKDIISEIYETRKSSSKDIQL